MQIEPLKTVTLHWLRGFCVRNQKTSSNWMKATKGNTLGSTHDDFGFIEYKVTTSWFLCANVIDSKVRLQRVSTENEQFLLPATKLRQGNVFTSVCQEFCPQWGACMAGGWACMVGACAWQGVYMAGGMCGGGHAWQGSTCGRGCVHGTGVCVAGKIAIAAGGTHPTGMHSCLCVISLVVSRTQCTHQ